MKGSKSFNLGKFINLYIKFNKIDSWNKEKHILKEELFDYLNKHKSSELEIHTRSGNRFIKFSHDFLILKLSLKSLGHFYPYRDKWVFLYSTRERYYMYYKLIILPKDFNPDGLISSEYSFDFSKFIKIQKDNNRVEYFVN